MTEPNQETSVRKLGPSSGTSGDGLTAEFEFTETIISDPKLYTTKTLETSLRSTYIAVEKRPSFLQFLQHIRESMDHDRGIGVACDPCQLAIELTYRDQTVRLETSLEFSTET